MCAQHSTAQHSINALFLWYCCVVQFWLNSREVFPDADRSGCCVSHTARLYAGRQKGQRARFFGQFCLHYFFWYSPSCCAWCVGAQHNGSSAFSLWFRLLPTTRLRTRQVTGAVRCTPRRTEGPPCPVYAPAPLELARAFSVREFHLAQSALLVSTGYGDIKSKDEKSTIQNPKNPKSGHNERFFFFFFFSSSGGWGKIKL